MIALILINTQGVSKEILELGITLLEMCTPWELAVTLTCSRTVIKNIFSNISVLLKSSKLNETAVYCSSHLAEFIYET